MLLARGGKVLYVANANRNTVSVIDTEAGKAVETIGTAIDPSAPSGSTPSSLALSPDESVLFVANANTNNLAVVNVKEPARARRSGSSRPAGIRPRCGSRATARRSTSPTARGPRRRPTARARTRWRRRRRQDPRVHRRAVPGHALDHPDARRPKQMAALLEDGLRVQPAARRTTRSPSTGPAPEAGNPIPAKVGDPSPIKHCVYIIKENRTYDQVFGDMPEGNGEPSLCLFPETVTPNHHALAREFVLLDNFYVDGEVSADGHEWTMGAYATDYVERTWPLSYRGDRRVPVSRRRGAGDRPARRRLPLGPRRGEGRQLPQLRRVHRERHDARRPRHARRSRRSRATSTRSSAATTWTIPT